MANFKCITCQREYDHSNFFMKVNKLGVLIYENKLGEELLCECGGTLDHIDISGPVGFNFGSFASMPVEQKEKYFKDISKQDFKKHGQDYIREAKKRENKNNNPI